MTRREAYAKVRNEKKEREAKTLSKETAVCPQCGEDFIKKTKHSTYCSKKCYDKLRSRNYDHKKKRIKQLKANGNYDNGLTLTALRLRDKEVCAICGKRVNAKDYEWRNGAFITGNRYPSIDHIKPVSKGGTHTWDNVQLAHKHCNSIKNACDLYETANGQLKMSV